MRRLYALGRTGLAVAMGLGPGLALPFVLALRLSPQDSDRAVLAFSVSTSLMVVLVPAIEATSIAAAGFATRVSGRVDSVTYRRLVQRALKWALPFTLVGASLLAFIYGIGHPEAGEIWKPIAVLALAPAIGAASAVNSGILLSGGRTFLPIASQGFRAILPLFAVVVAPGIPTIGLALLFVAGETVRFGSLVAARRHFARVTTPTNTDPTDGELVLEDRDLPWQVSANALAEVNPALARAYLAPYPGGTVTAFELGEKIVGASIQVAYNFVLLPRLGSWSTAHPRTRYELFKRGARILFGVSLGSSILGIVAIQVALAAELLPTAWTRGLGWACIALVGGPAISVTGGAARYIAILGAQRPLAGVVALVVVANALLAGIAVHWFGPVGAVVTLVATRYLLMTGALLLIRRRERELAPPRRT